MSAYRTLDLDEVLEEYDDLTGRAVEADQGDELDDDDRARLADLESFDAEIGGIKNAVDNCLELIEETDFQDYAEDYADSVGDIPDWLASYIDWEKFANDLQMDYTSISFDGMDYLYRP